MKKHLLLLGISFLSYNFATAQCEAVSSLDETFGGTALPDCWTGSHSYPNIMPGDEVTFYSGNSATAEIYLISPEIIEFNGQQTLSFTAAGTSMTPVLQIGTLAIADDFSTFVAVGDEIALGEESTYSVSIPASETQKFIAFKFIANGAPHAAGILDNVVFQTTASVGQVEQNSFRIYPNPVSSVLNIESNSEVKSVEIFDLTGRKVAVSVLNNTVNVSSLTQGTYIINITSDNGSAQTKFIKR